MEVLEPLEYVDIGPEDRRRLLEVLPVLRQLRPHLTEDGFLAIYAEGHRQGLRFTAAYRNGECVGVAGWRIVVNTHRSRSLYVDDLVTAEHARSEGVGAWLLGHLEQRARTEDCEALSLSSGTHRVDAHRFYHREGLTISSFNFDKPLADG